MENFDDKLNREIELANQQPKKSRAELELEGWKFTDAQPWKVGDLITWNSRVGKRQSLYVGKGHFIEASGFIEQSWFFNQKAKEEIESVHNTGLVYQYKNLEQVKSDWLDGLFTPYFEIL